MADTSQGGGVGAPTQPAGGGNADPRLEAIRGKRLRGETLTKQELGLESHAKAVAAGRFQPGGKRPGTGPRGPVGLSNPGNPLLAGVPKTEAQNGSVVRPPPDPSIVRSTVAGIIEGVGKVGFRLLYSESKAAGATDETARQIGQSALMDPTTKDMIIAASPDALRELGIDVTRWPVYVFCGGLLTWFGSIGVGVISFRRLAAERHERESKKNPPAAAPSVASPAGTTVEAKGFPLPEQRPSVEELS